MDGAKPKCASPHGRGACRRHGFREILGETMNRDNVKRYCTIVLESLIDPTGRTAIKHIGIFAIERIVGEETLTSRVQRDATNALRGASPSERNRAIEHAGKAVRKANVSIVHMAQVSFGLEKVVARVVKHLEAHLDTKETNRAEGVIRLTYKYIIADIRAKGLDRQLMDTRTQDKLDAILHRMSEEPRSTLLANPRATTEGRIAERQLADPVYREQYFGSAHSDAVERLEWDWAQILRQQADLLVGEAEYQKLPVPPALRGVTRPHDAETMPGILARLQRRDFAEALAELEESQRRAKASFRVMRPALAWLRRQIERPNFGTAILITGSWGSGKSRLLDEIADESLSRRRLVLYVDSRAPGTLRETIFMEASQSIGKMISTRSELELEARQYAGICVIIDDWEVAVHRNRDRNSELLRLMADWSGLPVRWVIAVDETAMPLMLDRNATKEWRRFGWDLGDKESNPHLISGWLHLDDRNEAEGIGIDLIRYYLGPSPELEELKRQNSSSMDLRRALSQPLLAILKSTSGAVAATDEAHLPAVLERYWISWLAALETAPKSELLLDSLVDDCCASLAGMVLAGDEISTSRLKSIWRPEGMLPHDRKSTLNVILSVLIYRRFLAPVRDSLVPDDASSLLWGYLLSREYQRRLGTTSDIAVEGFLGMMRRLAKIGDAATRAAIRIALLEVASASIEINVKQEIFDAWLRDPDLPSGVLWESAVALPAEERYSLMRSARDVGPRAEDAFWVIRFVRIEPPRSSPESVEALQFLTRIVSYVEAGGLSDYFRASLERCIRSLEWGVLADALLGLELLQKLVIPELVTAIANAVVDHVCYDTKSERLLWLDVLRQFTLDRCRDAEFQYSGRSLWRELVSVSLEEIGRTIGPRIMVELIDAGWYSHEEGSGSAHKMQWALRQSGHVAFGHTWRHNRREFVNVADKLIEHGFPGVPAYRQSAAALFGIRHTRTTRGGRVAVSSVFERHLDELRINGALRPSDRQHLRLIYIDDL